MNFSETDWHKILKSQFQIDHIYSKFSYTLGMNEYIFVVLEYNNEEPCIYRFQEKVWKIVKEHIDSKSIIFITKDIADKELRKYKTIHYSSLLHLKY